MAGEQVRVAPRAAHVPVATDRRARPSPRVVVSVATGVVAALLFWIVHSTLIDDAYITLDYARNLAFHFHWGLIRQETANSATSPLFVVLVASTTAITRNAVFGLGVAFVGIWVALATWLTRAATAVGLRISFAALAVLLLLLNPWLLSATGMETLLIAAILAGLLCYAVEQRPIAFGVVAGAGLLARVDIVIFVAVLVLGVLSLRRALLRITLAMAAVSGPWFIWSWLRFGSAIPDTFVIKTLQRKFAGYSFATGLRLWADFKPGATYVSFVTAALGAVALLVWFSVRHLRPKEIRAQFDPVAALGAGGIAYYLAYCALRVPPYQWYYGPTLVSLSIALVFLLPALPFEGARIGFQRVRLPVWTALLAAVVAAEAGLVVDNGVPWRPVAAVNGNWATPAQYARIGRELRRIVGDRTVMSPGEIGTLAYFCDCAIVDEFADRGLVVPQVERRVAGAGLISRSLLRLNYTSLDRSRLPRLAEYALVYVWPGDSNKPLTWNADSNVGPGHFELQPLQVDDRVLNRFVDAVTTLPAAGHGLVLIGNDSSLGLGAAYRDALASALKRRGVDVRLDPVTFRAPHASYDGRQIGAAVRVASGSAIDDLLAKQHARLLAYAGGVSWEERVAIVLQLANIAAAHRSGRIANTEAFFQTVALDKALGSDIGLLSIPLPNANGRR